MLASVYCLFFFFQAEDGIRDAQESRGLGDVYKRQRRERSVAVILRHARGPLQQPAVQVENVARIRLAPGGALEHERDLPVGHGVLGQIIIDLSLIHISEPTRLLSISYAVFCLKKKTKHTHTQILTQARINYRLLTHTRVYVTNTKDQT